MCINTSVYISKGVFGFFVTLLKLHKHKYSLHLTKLLCHADATAMEKELSKLEIYLQMFLHQGFNHQSLDTKANAVRKCCCLIQRLLQKWLWPHFDTLELTKLQFSAVEGEL